MKSETCYPAPVAKKLLVACLAALVSVSAPVWAQDAAATATEDEEGVTTLTAFDVVTDKDYGYLKTNAATATKIGMEIQKIPLNVSVISREFLDDTNARSLTDLFRYSAAASGDTRFAMRIPANSATPQGTFTMRGFVVNSLMKNGVFRYTSYNLDTIERVEVIKGPASVFFGQGYPGGVINYISKTPQFTKIPSTITIQNNSYTGQKVVLDHNAVLSKKAALRIVGSWEDTQGERRFEFRRGYSFNPSLALNPLDSGKVKILLEGEFLKEAFQYNDYDWIYSDFAGWKAAATAGLTTPTALWPVQTAARTVQNTIFGNAGNKIGETYIPATETTPASFTYTNVLQDTTTPTLAYATYFANKRVVDNNYTLPAYTSIARGAFITDASGAFVHDEAFNWTSRGSVHWNLVRNYSATVDIAATDWLDIRYNYFDESNENDTVGQGGALQLPYADGIHWNVLTGNRSGYYRYASTHNVDAVLKFDTFGIKSKILLGFQRINPYQQFMGGQTFTDAQWAFLPGASNTVSNPDYRGTNVNIYNHGGMAGVPNQVIRQRDGSIKPVRQIFANFDPGFEIYPDISVYHQTDRNALDGYKVKNHSAYVNYQGTLLDDRLTVMAGYREEKRWERGQFQPNNYPWYIFFTDMHLNTAAYPENQWGYGAGYQRGLYSDQKGSSWMGGASFAVTKDISVYASNSKTFKFNAGRVSGLFVGDEVLWYNAAAAFGMNGTTPGTFTYLNQTITSLSQFQSILAARGVYDMLKNETGMNWEFGAKISKDDGKLVGTISFFRGERENQMLDDGAKQSPQEEPLNSNITLFPVGSPFRNTRLLRWRTTDLLNRVEGSEAEIIWTPMRNYQAIINGSWLWTAKTVSDKTRAAPGSAVYNAYNLNTPAGNNAKVAADIYYGARLENVPEYRLNMFHRYTFTDGPARGGSVGLGIRYSSETVVSRTVDWNPLAGGYQAGDYLVFDLTLSYPWEISGYKINTRVGVYNLTDVQYSEGSFALSPSRNWTITNTLSF